MNQPTDYDELQTRSIKFAKRWENETSENAEAHTFWDEFFAVFGHDRKNLALYEQTVQKLIGGLGFIDVYWPGVFAAEHKSAGADLDKALAQLLNYLHDRNLKLPRLLVASDFASMHVLDLETNTQVDFPLSDLPKHVTTTFAPFHSGAATKVAAEAEEAITAKAAKLMADLYEAFDDAGYPDHDLAVLLVRLVFLMFADDTQVWEPNSFTSDVEGHSAADLGGFLAALFQTLDTPREKRPEPSKYEYVNGGLFADVVRIPHFTDEIRDLLLRCCHYDWSSVSPVIFGSIFQSVMAPETRRQLGAHYTAEANIRKVIEPLVFDDLANRYAKAAGSIQALRNLQAHLGSLRFLDPACGCGNFLMVTYRELRHLELAVMRDIRDLETATRAKGQLKAGQLVTKVDELTKLNPSQFYGIEIAEFPARIAETGMYLIDHLANLELSREFGQHLTRFPIADEATITHANALRADWNATLPADLCSYVLGNPPFAGRRYRTEEQTNELKAVWGSRYKINLDYVTGWYAKTASYIAGRSIRAAFVSTNSISQGAQVAPLWGALLASGIRIDFAHQTFAWQSDLSGSAAVHVVIVGFSDANAAAARTRRLFAYTAGIKGDPIETKPARIGPYLIPGSDSIVKGRTKPLSADMPPVAFGSMARDGGSLFIDDEIEYRRVVADPTASGYVRRVMGSREMLHGLDRWCLWMEGASPGSLRHSKVLRDRLEAVRNTRLSSPAAETRALAVTPWLFAQRAQPKVPYLAIPRVVSENREWFVVGHYPPDVIATDLLFTTPDPDQLVFCVLSSRMFYVWLSVVGGRLKSDHRFSKKLVYNTFPLPRLTDTQRVAICTAGAQLLDARKSHAKSTLADLYDPLVMPPNVRAAHRQLDQAVDKVFRPRKRRYDDDTDRLSDLLARYEKAVAQ